MTEPRKPRRRESSPGERPADDRPLFPHNDEAERAVLGAVLIDNDQFERIASWVDDAFFFHDSHSRIWEAMVSLSEAGKAIDLVGLKDELARTGELDNCGGPAYVASLTDGVPRASNITHYAEILQELKTKRSLAHYARRILDAVRSGDQAPKDILAHADQALLGMIGQHDTTKRLVSMEQAVNDHFKTMAWRVEHRGELLGLNTGFEQINDVSLGWQRGDLTIVAARPSMGKTAFVLNSIIASAKQGAKWAIFSLEMKRAQLMDRLIAAESGIPVTRILTGYIADADYEKMALALSTISGLSIHIDDRTRLTADDVRRTCRRLKLEGGLDGFVVDYIQLMSGSRELKHANRTEQLDDSSRRLKECADEHDAACLALSQLSRPQRGQEGNRPVMSDLRQSGGLEQNADVVAFIHRDNHKVGGLTEFIMDKQRMGPTGTVMMSFDRDLTKFSDEPLASVPEPPPPPPPSAKRRSPTRKRRPASEVLGF